MMALIVSLLVILATTLVTPTQAQRCQRGEFQCLTGAQCIDAQKRCDVRRDCSDGSDEDRCPRRCDPNREIQCGDGKCVPINRRCDGASDCGDNRDEQGCAHTWKCNWDEFVCDGGHCVPYRARCDGLMQCRDARDEMNCPSLITIQISSSSLIVNEGGRTEFTCAAYCPRAIRDCRVEWGYRAVSGALPSEVRATGQTLQIFNATGYVSGQYFCSVRGYPTTSDSVTLIVNPRQPTQCRIDEYLCRNTRCVSRDLLCNSRDDCGDNSDEQNCVTGGGQCEPPEFRCRNQKCVQKNWRCDGDDDCRDGSDELIEYCPTKPRDSLCNRYQESCADGLQCIPRSYLCDGQFDCQDRSDEIGCTDPRVTQPPPPTLIVTAGGTIRITCRAVGKPIPIISWRLNWGPIPTGSRVTETSVDGYGVLVISNARVSDSGAYTCEAINNQNAKFAQPDIIVTVTDDGFPCPRGQYNMNARRPEDCIDCFCFGIADQCTSSGWFIEQRPINGGDVDLVRESGDPILPQIHAFDSISRETSVPFYSSDAPSGVLYWRLPSREILGNQLKSYGGYLRYKTKHDDGNREARASNRELILRSPRRDVFCTQRNAIFSSGSWTDVEIELVESNCIVVTGGSQGDVSIPEESPATREDLMMVLQDVEAVLIRATFARAQRSVTIKDITIEKAELGSRSTVPANKVETCQCPDGYQGMSCEDCAPGFTRTIASARFPLGECVGDIPDPICNPMGTARIAPDGTCICKQLAMGPLCDQCRPETFYMNADAENGCVECFCMGITSQCISSPYSRTVVRAETRSTRGWEVTEEDGENLVQNVLTVSNGDIEVDTSALGTGVYYMKLPVAFSGNQLGAYGGTLRFKLRVVAPSVTRMTIAPDVILGSENIQLYADYATEPQTIDANTREFDVAIPILERFWSRADRQQTTHEHLLMALADVEYILVKLSAVDIVLTAVLAEVSLDVADPKASNSNPRADAVEQCRCPVEYVGESCESCAPGFQRAPGLYLGICQRSLCQCNGHSDDCDAQRGICINCQHGTTGRFCENCAPGYQRNLNSQSPYDCLRIDDIAVIEQPTITVRVYGRAELVCRAFAADLPVSSIIWRRVDNRPLNRDASQTDGRLVIPRVVRDDGGDYICVVTTTGNIQGTGIATIDVIIGPQCPTGYINPPRCDECDRGYYKDRFGQCQRSVPLSVTVSPSRSDLTEGESVVLVCRVTSPVNDYSIIWETPNSRARLGQRVDGRAGDPGPLPDSYRGATFTVDPVRTSDAGTYRCTARRRNGEEASAEANVFVRRVTVREPRITLEPSGPQNIVIGGSLELRCSAVDPNGRSLRVQWEKDGRPLAAAGVSTLYIREASARDTGTYKCTVTLENQIFTSTIIVTVRPNISPQISARIEPGKLEVAEGQNGRLKCVVRGDAREVVWRRSRGEINPLFTRTTDQIQGDTLIITGMTVNDRDYYYCTALGNDLVTSVESTPVIVDVQRGPVNPPTVKPPVLANETEVLEGLTVRMDCRADGSFPVDRIAWTRDGASFDSRFQLNGGVLILTNANIRDTGRYICTVTYTTGQRTQGSTRLIVRPRDVPNRPVISIEGPTPGSNMLSLIIGETGMLRCYSDDQRARYSWSRSDNSPMARNVIDQGDGRLIIRTAALIDAGAYVCVASNEQGSSSAEGYVRVTGTIVDPVDPTGPTIVLPRTITAEEGGIAELMCSVNSRTRDVPYVYWRNQRGQPLTQRLANRAVLRFDPVTLSNRGEYTCVAEIPGASSSSSTFLDVRAAGGPFNWEQNPLTVTKQIGESVELECQPTGQSPTRTTWEKVGADDLPLGADQTGSKLAFNRLRLSDSGTYTCTAESSSGNAVLYVDLIIEGPPATPVVSADGTRLGPNGVKTYNAGVKVTLSCLADGSPSPKYEWSRMLSQGGFQKIENGPNIQVMAGDLSSEVIIYEVKASDAGYYNCTAYNDYGKREVFSRVAVNAVNVGPTDVIVSGSGEGSSRNLYKPGQTAILRCIASSTTPVTYKWTFSGGELLDNVITSNAVLRINNLNSDNRGTYYCTVSNEGGDSSPVAAQVYVEGTSPRSGVPSAPKPLIGSTTRQVGESVRLTCPLPSSADRVEWARQDRSAISQSSETSSQGQILEIFDLKESDFGVYLCTAVNNVGSSIPARINLIEEGTSIGPGQSITDVKEGDTVVLECLKPDNAIRTLWTRDNNNALPPQAEFNETQLRIPNIRSEDAGTYYCTAYFSSGNEQRSRESVIAVSREGDFQLNTPQTAGTDTKLSTSVGETVKLTCSYPDGDDVELNWSRRGTNLPRTSYTTENDLVIENVQPEDAGVYYCIARREGVESRPLEYTVIVVGGTTEQPIDLAAPTISVSGDMTPGSTVDLSCSSDVVGVTFEWSRKDSDLPDGSRVSGPYLRLYNLELSSTGEYTCTIKNDQGMNSVSQQVLVLEESRPLSAIIEAQGTMISDGVYAAGRFLELECVANNDAATVTWSDYPDGAYVQGRTLVFPSLSEDQGGDYRCLSSLEGQQAIAEFSFIVPKGGNTAPLDTTIVELQSTTPLATQPQVFPPDSPFIQPSRRDVTEGESASFECGAIVDGALIRDGAVIYSWSKKDGQLPRDAVVNSAILTIPSTQQPDQGTYICTASNDGGISQSQAQLTVQARKIPETTIAAVPDNVVECPGITTEGGYCLVKIPSTENVTTLNCDTNSFVSWHDGDGNRAGDGRGSGMLKVNVDWTGSKLYSCRYDNNQLTFLLLKQDYLPKFVNDGTYMSLPIIKDAYLSNTLDVSVNPAQESGLILYASSSEGTDMLALGLADGYPIVEYNLGSGVETITSDQILPLDQFSNIQFIRNEKDVRLIVNGKEVKSESTGKFVGLDLDQMLFVGGVPDSEIFNRVGFNQPFQGTLSRLVVQGEEIQFLPVAGLQDGNPCNDDDDLCKNGECVATTEAGGRKCICSEGWAGDTCTDRGVQCYIGYCQNDGHCMNMNDRPVCHCKLGYGGANCEIARSIENPKFSGDGFISYPALTDVSRSTSIEIVFKPSATVEDGLLAYVGENRFGSGDYLALLIKDGVLRYTFDLGGGPAVIVSETKLEPNSWYKVEAERTHTKGTLSLNGGETVTASIVVTTTTTTAAPFGGWWFGGATDDDNVEEGDSSSRNIGLNVNTNLFIGGVDSKTTKVQSLADTPQFTGCVSRLAVGGRDIDLIQSAVSYKNIQSCSEDSTQNDDPCLRLPCENSGVCKTVNSKDYECICSSKYTGVHCEMELNGCTRLSESPCLHNGLCQPVGEDNYKCLCMIGYGGPNCAQDKTRMALAPQEDTIKFSFDSKYIIQEKATPKPQPRNEATRPSDYFKHLFARLRGVKEKKVSTGKKACFGGGGYLELPRNLLPTTSPMMKVQLTVKTSENNGVLYWQGQPMELNGAGKDFYGIGLEDGYVKFSFELGGGPVIIKSKIRVNDGEHHKIVAERDGRKGSLIVDGELPVTGMSGGTMSHLNGNGNIYLGGVPHYRRMVADTFQPKFVGCISHVKTSVSNGAVDLFAKKISGMDVNPGS